MSTIPTKATDYVPVSLWEDLSRADARVRTDTTLFYCVRVEGEAKSYLRQQLAKSEAALEAARLAIIEAASINVVTVALDLKRTSEASAAEEGAAAKERAAAKSMAQQSDYVKLLDGLYPEEQP